MKSIKEFYKAQQEKRPFTMISCYDAWSAELIKRSPIDCVLIGDSVSMVVHGHKDTLAADTDLMALHTSAVARVLKDEKFLVGDLPFLSYRKSLSSTMNAVEKLMKAGAHSVKLEGVQGHEKDIAHIVQSGVPVMGHLGLTPQSLHALGGYKVQGRAQKEAAQLIEDAKKLQDLGCFALVLECVPTGLAQEITSSLEIPSIGIGAGPHCNGQVLVLQDLLGLNTGFQPKFLRTYLNGKKLVAEALQNFQNDVESGNFPSEKESYSS